MNENLYTVDHLKSLYRELWSCEDQFHKNLDLLEPEEIDEAEDDMAERESEIAELERELEERMGVRNLAIEMATFFYERAKQNAVEERCLLAAYGYEV